MNKLNMLIFSLGVTRKDKIRNESEEQLKLNELEISEMVWTSAEERW